MLCMISIPSLLVNACGDYNSKLPEKPDIPWTSDRLYCVFDIEKKVVTQTIYVSSLLEIEKRRTRRRCTMKERVTL